MQVDKRTGRIRLSTRPSFLKGVARLVDPFGLLNRYYVSNSPEEADSDALLSDWTAVGDDLRYAIRQHRKSLSKETRWTTQ